MYCYCYRQLPLAAMRDQRLRNPRFFSVNVDDHSRNVVSQVRSWKLAVDGVSAMHNVVGCGMCVGRCIWVRMGTYVDTTRNESHESSPAELSFPNDSYSDCDHRHQFFTSSHKLVCPEFYQWYFDQLSLSVILCSFFRKVESIYIIRHS